MLVVSALCAVGHAGEKEAFPEQQRELELPALEGLAQTSAGNGALLGSWRALASGSTIDISLSLAERHGGAFVEPEEVHEELVWADDQREDADAIAWDRWETFAGPLGHAPYAHLVSGTWREGASGPAGRLWSLAGLLADGAWVLRVECAPAPAAELEQRIAKFLRGGLRYSGEVRDGSWTAEEIAARWEEYSPRDAIEDAETTIETEHYMIIGNSSGSRSFAKKMEQAYDEVQEVYSFPELPGRKKLLVFLFKTKEQYVQYFAKIAEISAEQAARSKGHAWRDYYATWYEAPGDPVHIHEATHQIFMNRLFLTGAGSWFQEGVAEYISSQPGDRGAAASAVTRGRHTPLPEIMEIESLLMSSDADAKGGDGAGDNYKQAALLVEFVRESKFGKAKFADYIQRMGRVPDNDVAAIEAVLLELFGTNIADFEREFVRYCQKR